MADQQEWEKHFTAFLESSSLLAHDISGQAHVAQFCADELGHKLQQMGSETKFVERLQESLAELSELSILYRQFIKDQAPENMTTTFWKAHQACVRTLNLHYFKDRERLNFEVDPALQTYDAPQIDSQVQQVLYALYFLCLEGVKREQIKGSVFKIEWVEKEESRSVHRLLLTHDQGLLEESKLLALSSEDSIFAGKTYRRSNSLMCFKKALQGKLEAVKIVFGYKHAHALLLELKSKS